MDSDIKIDKKVDLLIKKVFDYSKKLDKKYIELEIKKAYNYAKDAHSWQFRLSWEPYIVHPLEASFILLQFLPDIHTIQACLLHDVIEDTPRTYKDIENTFWEEVAFLCSWMEKISKVKYRWEERTVWSLRKIFIAMAEDLRVVFIKLSDRLHNMKTLSFHPKKEKRDRIALETLNIYSPIADRLWLYSMKNALDEESFKILNFPEYIKLKKELKQLAWKSISFIENAENEIANLLDWVIENFEIDYRVKSIYSIYKKIKKKWLSSVNWLYDLFWIRVIVSDVSDCYRVLWIIHNKYKPIPNRFKDYIALPKPNWYRSLHTTIIWLLKDDFKQPAEIQIKTYEMKEYSDIWVAAHFEYKENWSKKANDIDWVKELKELTENLENSDFMDSLKIDVFKDRIFVFTPKWDSINLPSWSTVIDFAYYVHTDLWNHIAIANVNWKVYPLDKELHNWDVIEIIIDRNRKPNPFWLSFVKTTKARNKIKSYLKREDRDERIERWREIISKYLVKSWLPILDKELSILKNLDWRVYNFEDRLTILEQLWNFSISPISLIRRIYKSKNISNPNENKKNNKITLKKDLDENWKQEIIIWWEEWLPYKLCYCCRRRIPKDIVSHINSKWIITIHKRDCKILDSVNKDRLIYAYIKWNEKKSIFVEINLVLQNDIWVLKEITNITYSMEINIDEINTNKIDYRTTEISLRLEVLDYDYLIIDRLIERLKLNLWEKLLSINVK
jgi:guanosine-3',5'-bis(diphosphate) 3'-pyrophosphohydrolase